MKFADALAQPGLGAIAEFKRRSPSMGDIRPDARVESLLPLYASNGASAISVLVDARFGGTVEDLVAARAATEAPLIAKGFFSDEGQLLELRRAGADAVLLILRDLDDATCARLLAYAEELGMDALVEAHDDAELQRAISLPARIIGVNARDLSTFRIDRRMQLDLVARAPRDRLVIAESAVSGTSSTAGARRGLFSTRMKPSMSAPASTAASTSSWRVSPQTLTSGRESRSRSFAPGSAACISAVPTSTASAPASSAAAPWARV